MNHDPSSLKQTQNVFYSNLEELQLILNSEKEFFLNSIVQDINFLNENDVNEIKIRFIGKNSPLQDLLKSLKNIEPAARKNAGALINHLKSFLEAEFSKFLSLYENYAEEKKISTEWDDISLPALHPPLGSRHPIAIVLRDLLEPFRRMGFSITDGPEIDTDFYNFEALNIPKHHPAREMQDTFFVASEWVLRTHTSNVQSHALKEKGPPLRIVCPGCVYRNEHDLTHVPAFRQIECLVVDKNVHMGHLRHVVQELLSAAFRRAVKLRFRSSYFPFTEPSAEVDVECQQCFGGGCRSCKGTGWSEIGGCGVVNPQVLFKCGVDASVYSGIAFGFGVDRIAKDRFAIDDLRALSEGQISFSKLFSSF